MTSAAALRRQRGKAACPRWENHVCSRDGVATWCSVNKWWMIGRYQELLACRSWMQLSPDAQQLE